MSSFDDEDSFHLIQFDTVSDALTQVRPGARLFYNTNLAIENTDQPVASGSSSPPRKTARLDSDLDHSASVSRVRSRAYGHTGGVLANTTNESNRDGPVVWVVDGLPDLTVPDKYITSCVKKVQQAITDILQKKPITWCYEEVYQATRTIVLTSDKGDRVFDRLRIEFKQATTYIIDKLLGLDENTDPLDWLYQLVDGSNWFDRCVSLLEKLLTYLNYSRLAEKNGSIRHAASDMFLVHVLSDPRIGENIQTGVLTWARWERENRKPHEKRQTILSIVGITIKYHIFEGTLLESYLRNLSEFYSEESSHLAGKNTVTSNADRRRNATDAHSTIQTPQKFVDHCTERIEEEKARAQTVLGAYDPCIAQVVQTVEMALLAGRLEWLSQGVVTALDERSKSGLARIYALFSRVNGLKVLCDAYKAHVQTIVQKIVLDKARDEEMVDRLVQLKTFLNEVIQSEFTDEPDITIKTETQDGALPSTSAPTTTPQHRRNPSASSPVITPKHFASATNDAFTAGFKARHRVPAEMIAKYLDRAMRRGQKNDSDEVFEKMLSGALGLYRFTQDRDVFRRFYHNALAKRLLTQRSASDDFEKLVLKKLRDQYDSEFSMGDHMFHDLEISREFADAFHAKPHIEGTSAQNLTVMVLQRSFWPFNSRPAKKEDVLLPAKMQANLDKFTAFYKSSHSGRKLDYDHSYGTVTLKARFDAAQKDLSLSLYQAVVLLLFNGADKLRFGEIKDMIGMDDGELRRTLQSLACGQKRVLKKEPAGKEVNERDTFIFNAAFTDPRPRVHINTIHVRETPEESQRTHTAIEGDRKHYLDAAIVRIMKARKTVDHKDLVMATTDAVKKHFSPEVRTIKERIEQLIEQEYMRRDEERENVYVYVA